MANAISNENIDRIRQRFITKLHAALPSFRNLVKNLKEHPNNIEEIENIRMQVHKFSGSAQLFGFPHLTRYAAKVEPYLDKIIDGHPIELFLDPLTTAFSAFLTEAEAIIADPTKKIDIAATAPPTTYSILIASENSAICDLLKQHYGSTGNTILTAHNENETLICMHTDQPDICILDITPPAMHGKITLKHMKNNPAIADIPVIILSPEELPEDIGSTEDAIAYPVFHAPFTIEDISACVTNILQQRNTA